jgi:hypothetical protein
MSSELSLCVVCSLFNNSVGNLNCIASAEWVLVNNELKGCMRKWLWPNLRYCVRICAVENRGKPQDIWCVRPRFK